MKKGLLGVVALATLLLVGCSSDEEMANIESAARNAIDFNVAASSMETKATPIFNYSYLIKNQLDVFAYYSESGALYMGNPAGNDGIDIVYYKNSKWDYKNSLDKAYWPSRKLNFYAICPATIAEANRDNCNWLISGPKSNDDGTNSTNTVFCRLVDEYNPQRNEKTFNYDLMYATAFNYDKNTNDSKVKLTFKHALTQVIFKALTADSTMVGYVRSLKIKNLKNCGTFTIPTELTEENENYARNPKSSDWALVDSSYDSFSDCIEKEILINDKGSDPVRLSNIYKPLFVLPQISKAWSTTPTQPVSIAEADKNHETYLEISMKLIDDGKYLFGSETEYETVYLPFNTIHMDSYHHIEGWQPGYRYVYRIYFGGGYDAQGKLIQKGTTTIDTTVEERQSLISFACGN